MTKATQSQSNKRRESIVRGGSSKRGESGSRRPDSQIRSDCATNRNYLFFFKCCNLINLVFKKHFQFQSKLAKH